MARPKKPIAGTGGTETVADAAATAALAAPQATEPTGAAGGVAAPSAAPVDAPINAGAAQVDPTPTADPTPVRPTHGAPGYVLTVTGPAKGRWRAGRKFGPEPTAISASELTEAECQAIVDDPELTFELTKVEP